MGFLFLFLFYLFYTCRDGVPLHPLSSPCVTLPLQRRLSVWINQSTNSLITNDHVVPVLTAGKKKKVSLTSIFMFYKPNIKATRHTRFCRHMPALKMRRHVCLCFHQHCDLFVSAVNMSSESHSGVSTWLRRPPIEAVAASSVHPANSSHCGRC